MTNENEKIETSEVPRLNYEGKPIIGTDPECECDGDVITLWDCACRECRMSR